MKIPAALARPMGSPYMMVDAPAMMIGAVPKIRPMLVALVVSAPI